MKNIVLVNIASIVRGEEFLDRPPGGLLYVGGSLKRAGYNVHIQHISFRDIQRAVDKIIALSPIFVGFTAFTGSNVKHSAVMSKKIKGANSSIPIVWGGTHPSLCPEQCLKEDYIDVVVQGEGEETVLELTSQLINGREFGDVLGIGYKKDGKILVNKRRPLMSREELDKQELDYSLVDPNRYIFTTEDGAKAFRYITSRGCPFSCGFCYNRKFNMQTWRPHSADVILQRIKLLREKYHFDRVCFDDDYFFVDQERGFKIIGGLRELQISVENFDLHLTDLKNESVIERLHGFGIRTVFFGWESGTERILKLINKKITPNEIFNNISAMTKFPDLKIESQGIIGFPTESIADMENTLKLALRLIRAHPSIHIHISTYLPFPGSELYELAIKSGFVPPAKTEGWGEINYWDEPTWLKWLTPKERKRVQNMAAYSAVLNRTKTAFANAKLKRFIKNCFFELASMRIKYRFYIFPIDLWLFNFSGRFLRKKVLRIAQREHAKVDSCLL